MDDLTETIAASMQVSGPAPLSVDPELGPFIYYIQCGSFLKIGTSINPEKRCDQLRRGGKAIRPSIWVGNPQLIAYVPGNVAREKELHREFAAKHDQGEWFLLDDELADHVADEQSAQCLMEIQAHQQRYEEFTGTSLDLAGIYQQHLRTKSRIDLEWIEAFDAA
jgi:hypothetical protein